MQLSADFQYLNVVIAVFVGMTIAKIVAGAGRIDPIPQQRNDLLATPQLDGHSLPPANPFVVRPFHVGYPGLLVRFVLRRCSFQS